MIGRWLDRLRGIRTAEDPTFGTLRTLGRGGVWEGAVPFAPTGEKVDLLLDAGPSGPGEPQRRFLTELARRYHALLPAVMETIHAAATTEPRDLRLVVIDIPAAAAEPGRCELTYESESGALFSVELNDWSPRVVGGAE